MPVNATDLRFAAGYLWAVQSPGSSIERIPPHNPAGLALQGTGVGPSEVAVVGRRLFVTSTNDNTLRILDRSTLKPVHEPVPMPFNPYGIEFAGNEVWVTSMALNSVTRVRFR